jgi:hypothetical protein
LDKISAAPGPFYAAFDIFMAFYSINLAPETAKLFHFHTLSQSYQLKKLPMGLKISPIIWSQLTHDLLGDLEDKLSFYLDDIFCHCPSIHDLLDTFRQLFQRLRDADLKLSVHKSFCGTKRLKLLGHVLENRTIRPCADKVKVMRSMPDPKDVTELRRILGAFNFYRSYLPNYQILTAPLYKLLSKRVPFVWTNEESAIFHHLKTALADQVYLTLPDWSREFRVSTDASLLGIGAKVSQLDPDTGQDKPIQFLGRKLSNSERSMAPIYLELSGICWAVTKLRHMLLGRKFLIGTDSKPLVQLLKHKTPKNIPLLLQRKILTMQSFDFEIVHTPGKFNCLPDLISRSTALPLAEKPAPVENVNTLASEAEYDPATVAIASESDVLDAETEYRTVHQRLHLEQTVAQSESLLSEGSDKPAAQGSEYVRQVSVQSPIFNGFELLGITPSVMRGYQLKCAYTREIIDCIEH